MIIRFLILCSCWGSFSAWGGFFNIEIDDNTNEAYAVHAFSSAGSATTSLQQQACSSLFKYLNIGDNQTCLFQQANTDTFGNQHLRFKLKYHGIEVEHTQIIAHFNQGDIDSISGYQQLLSPALKTKIDAHLNKGITQLTAGEALAFIIQKEHLNPSQYTLLAQKPMIIQAQPYVIWQVELLVNGIAMIYRLSDNNPPQFLSKIIDIQS
ncbi:hypothetical protein SPONN_2296 [uncultured Candidatus Thioglobus sp.]|nr:hypothetical protein SPONN_2296 [uncultured Candidatus Thioglobus sp.]